MGGAPPYLASLGQVAPRKSPSEMGPTYSSLSFLQLQNGLSNCMFPLVHRCILQILALLALPTFILHRFGAIWAERRHGVLHQRMELLQRIRKLTNYTAMKALMQNHPLHSSRQVGTQRPATREGLKEIVHAQVLEIRCGSLDTS